MVHFCNRAVLVPQGEGLGSKVAIYGSFVIPILHELFKLPGCIPPLGRQGTITTRDTPIDTAVGEEAFLADSRCTQAN